ncbi:LicD family protein [Enterocloster aldenensis]|uniref:LicD family protein n=1 Tax=Enterocloster aldenensis TaxID=358742 RepID=UPI000E469AD4|nr:LicD family protein [Enterocloster aldenensis]
MRKKLDAHQLFKIEFFKNESVITLTDSQLKHLQLIELEIVQDFIAVVKKYNLTYTLGGGSVLGAIRHKGFIPWDDDIDINMPRKSFDFFINVFEQEMGEKYELWAPELGNGHGMSSVQIKKKGTIYQSFNELSKKNNGIYIDIFILENVPDNKIMRYLHGMLCLAFGYLLTCRKTYEDLHYLEPYFRNNNVLEKAFMKKARLGKVVSWISLDSLAKWTVGVYSLCKNNNTKLVSFPSGRRHYFGEIGLRSDMVSTIQVLFENIEVNIPLGYKAYMERLYGKTYMEIPPLETREQHPLLSLDFGDERIII